MSNVLVGHVHHLLDSTRSALIYVGGLAETRVWPYEYKAVFSPLDVVWDIDGDGVQEICVALHYRVVIYEGTTGRKESELRFHGSRSYGWFGLGDVDGDGRMEIVVLSDFQSHFDVLDYDPAKPEAGRLSVLWRRDVEPDIDRRARWPQVGPRPLVDVSGDGKPEIVLNLYNDAGDGEWPAYFELAHRLGVDQVIAKNLDVIVKDGDDDRRLFSHVKLPTSPIQQALETARQKAGAFGIQLRLYAMQPHEVTICEHNPLMSVFFNGAGEVSPCITLAYAESRVFDGQRTLTPCQRFGNIQQQALTDIWNKPEYRQFRQRYEDRLQIERQATLDSMLGGPESVTVTLPAAPEGCRTCYYLYGV